MEVIALLLVVIVWVLHTRTKNDLTRRIQALETDLYTHLEAAEGKQE
jgi:hypothetical protein